MPDHVVVFVTCGSTNEAEKIGETLVEEGLIACGSLIYPVRSVFRWKGKLCREEEVLLFLKTRRELLGQVVRRVGELHSYDVPEIIALPIFGGAPTYLKWIDEKTKKATSDT